MESVGSPKEEGKFNIPVNAPYIITYYSSYPKFLEQLENIDAERILVSYNDGSEAKNDGAT